jgi:hypothetical protein
MAETGNRNTTETPTNADLSQEAVGAPGENLPAGTGPVKVRASAPKIYRYPNNLDTKEQPHSVNFFISEYVPGGNVENIASQNAAINDVLGAPSARSGNGITAENAKNVNDQLRVAAAFVGALLGQQAGKKVGKAFGSLGETIGNVVGTAGGAVLIDQVISKNATSIKTAPAKRLNTAISLHVAQSPQAKYTAEYENESIGALLGTLATSEGSGVIGSLMTEAANGNAGELIGRGLVDAATIPKELGLGNANFGGLARAASKKVRNPFQEQIFKTMNFRSFAFQYKFAPRNQSEFDSVMDIIKLFKFHMHPTKADGGAFFTFPSIFDIEYRYKGERNSFVNKIATSVLTDMSVDYGSEGVFTTFRGTKGQPSEITLAMQFREISLLTKGENGDLTNGTGTGY